MKTIITLCIALAVSVCTAQEPAKVKENLITQAQAEEIKEKLTIIVEKLERNKDAIFSKEEAQLLVQKLESTEEKLAKSTVFSKIYTADTSPTSHTQVKYTITIDDKEGIENIEELKDLDLTTLSDTMADFITALQESPKIKELVTKLEQVQEKIEKTKKD